MPVARPDIHGGIAPAPKFARRPCFAQPDLVQPDLFKLVDHQDSMRGFCGIYDPSGGAGIDHGLVRDMTRLMAERGPDAEGFWFNNRVGLGHRRLSIIDLSAGEQPVFNEDRSVLVVFNGEIFNYQEVRRELEKAGHTFRTNTDTEVIVHAYEQYGERCVDHFRGMFAFFLQDTRSGEI